MMIKRIKLTGAMLRGYPLSRKIELARKIQERALPLIGTKVFPKIDSIFSLTEADRAHARMESNAHIGKIVLRVDFR
jgi:NADPH:quinone reductase-like Zn-dependent oxidoreductase